MKMTNLKEISDFLMTDFNQRPELYDIAFIVEQLGQRKASDSLETCGYYIAFKNVKTGYLHQKLYTRCDYGLYRNVFMCIKNLTSERADEFDILECYVHTSDVASRRHKVFFPKNQTTTPLQNKLKIKYAIFNIQKEETSKDSEYRDFFEFSFRNLSCCNFYMFTDDDLSFFNRFSNFEVNTPILEHQKLAEKMYNEHNKVLDYNIKTIEACEKRRTEEEETLNELQKIIDNSENVRNNLFTIISKEEISAQLLLKTLKKM